jgi:hypothetical protein
MIISEKQSFSKGKMLLIEILNLGKKIFEFFLF